MISYPEDTMVKEEQEAAEEQVLDYPPEPETLEECGLPVVLIEDLIFKTLLGKGMMTGREIAEDMPVL